MRTAIGIVVLVVSIGGVFLINRLARDDDGNSLLNIATEVEIPIETTMPEIREIIRTVQAPGEVEASAEVDISSEVMGKIIELPVEEGDFVRAGDLLCRLDDTNFRARVLSGNANVAKLEAMILGAEADEEKAQRDYDRQLKLLESFATSVTEIANYRTALIRARSALEVRKQELIEAQAALEAATIDLARTVITAPIDGVVSQLFAENGEVVITGTMNNLGTRIMVVSDMSVMQVRCRIDETDAPLVKSGQVARIYLQSDTRRSIPGEVFRVGIKGTKPVGRDMVTFETLVLIKADDSRVKPGMTANIEIEVARHENALTIPIQSVVYRKRRDLPKDLLAEFDRRRAESDPDADEHQAEYIKLVYCVEGDEAVARFVETGISDATRVEILDGIGPEDTLVIGPFRSLDQLKNGSAITRTEESDETSSPEKPAVAGTDESGDVDSTTAEADDADEPAMAASSTSDDDTPDSDRN